MSHFVTDLEVRWHTTDTSPDRRGTRSLLSPLVYCSDALHRLITVPAGFVSDFASVPRLPVTFLLTGDSAHEAAVIHDWLYSTHEIHGQKIDRATADAVFREACLIGEPAWRAWLMWMGVRIGGMVPYLAKGQRQPAHIESQMAS